MLADDRNFGIAVFQIVALPVVLLLLAWIVAPSGKSKLLDVAAEAEQRKVDERARWTAKKLLIPPLIYVVSGLLSLLIPSFSMAFRGISTFAVMWVFIFIIALNQQHNRQG